MIYTLKQIKELVEPIAKKYKLKALWVFGSYARGDAVEESDVDFLMDYTGSNIVTLLDLVSISDEIKESLNKNIDLISTEALFDAYMQLRDPNFVNFVSQERVMLYEII